MAKFLIWNGGVKRQESDVGSGYVQNIGVGIGGSGHTPKAPSSSRNTGHRKDKASVAVEPMEPNTNERKDRPGGRIPII